MWKLSIIIGLTLISGFVQAKDTLLIVRPDNEGTASFQTFESAIKGLRYGLSDIMQIFEFNVDSNTSAEDFKVMIDAVNPNLLVLMDNKTINLYGEFQKRYPERRPFLPALAIMAVFVGQVIENIENTIGIEYQVQGITSLTNFRSLFNFPVKRVGVIYRPEISAYFEQQKLRCAQEKIELIGLEVRRVGSNRIRRSIERLVQQEQVDALWILNDSVLLSPQLIREAWIPTLETLQIPTVVGIRHFITEENLFGHYGTIPDPFGLGDQAAELVMEIRDQNWALPNRRIHAPVSIEKYFNVKRLSSKLQAALDQRALLEQDEVIGEVQ